LKISVQCGERLSLDQIRAFVEASDELRFEAVDRKELYEWVGRTLIEQEYAGLRREAKGLVRAYMGRMTGLSRAQMTRLIRQYAETGMVRARSYRRQRFPTRYSSQDIALLAEVDEAHEMLSGPATQKILRRACHDLKDRRLPIWRGFR
jgi:DNA-binding transcriptional ArsR family regulator